MKVVADEIYRRFMAAPGKRWWRGTPISDVRTGQLEVGGRSRLILFDRHGPRLRMEAAQVDDPGPPGPFLPAPAALPSSSAGLMGLVAQALADNKAALDAEDLGPGVAPRPGERYQQNQVAAQRRQRFFGEARALLESCRAAGALADDELTLAARALTGLEWGTYSGEIDFDDEDIGTHFSYTKDEAFVHYMELLLDALPLPRSEAWAVLPREQRASVARQRAQLTNHLDATMRHRYAYDGVVESDIERSTGALLVQRRTHRIVSHDDWASGEARVPGFELLRVDPDAAGPHAGAWIHRAGDDLRLEDGTVIEVDPDHVLVEPVEAEDLTLQRAPGDPRLRPGMHFDWDSNGYITDEPLPWIKWSGYCDVQAIMEWLGLTFLEDDAGVTEYRSDTNETVTYTPELLREMAASMVEPGSAYQRVDTGERVQLTERIQGGYQAHGRHDRLDFTVPSSRRVLSWPMGGKREDFEVIGMEGPDGESLDAEATFQRLMPGEGLQMVPNPRFLKKPGGNLAYIDVVGLLLRVSMYVDVFDEETGYFRRKKQETLIDLREQPEHRICFLGTRLWSSSRREVFRYYLDRTDDTVVAELDRYEQRGGRWRARTLAEHGKREKLQVPLACNIRREVLRDDPAFFAPLLDAALRRGEGIITDTDMGGEVWNGVVTKVRASRLEADPETRMERWQVHLEARHGEASMDFLLRRGEDGQVQDACPCAGPDGWGDYPDFLWQQYPDVTPRTRHQGRWLVNMAMLGKGIVTLDPSSSSAEVFSDHVNNVSEVLYSTLRGMPWTIVHANERYGFRDQAQWKETVDRLNSLRSRIRFQRGRGSTTIKRRGRTTTE